MCVCVCVHVHALAHVHSCVCVLKCVHCVIGVTLALNKLEANVVPQQTKPRGAKEMNCWNNFKDFVMSQHLKHCKQT